MPMYVMTAPGVYVPVGIDTTTSTPAATGSPLTTQDAVALTTESGSPLTTE